MKYTNLRNEKKMEVRQRNNPSGTIHKRRSRTARYDNEDPGCSVRSTTATDESQIRFVKIIITACKIFSILAITLILIGGTLLYLYLREHHIGCYAPFNGKLCYSDVPEVDRYKWFATKTDYNMTAHLAKSEFETPPPVDAGCKPVLFYLFQRHTTRYPDREAIEESSKPLQELAKEIVTQEKSRLCKQDLYELSKWVFPFVPDQDNMVAPEGIRITEAQVERLSKRFPSVFEERRPFRSSSIHVDFTSRVRSRDTGYAFLSQWYTKDVFDKVIEPQIRNNVNDKLLQFHRECKDLLKRKGKFAQVPAQVAQLEASTFYSSLLETLSSRLGRKVSQAEMELMHKQCAYETAILGRSPWCAVFTEEDLKVIEFHEDLDDFYKDSFGYDINWQQACPVAQDLFEYILEIESPSYAAEFPRTVLHFSHAGAIKKVMSYFGVGRSTESQSPLTWNSVCTDRSWRSSHFAPFNANLLFVMYSCPPGPSSPESTYKMATFVNERQVQLPGCSEKFCPLNEFRDAFQVAPSSCNISHLCS